MTYPEALQELVEEFQAIEDKRERLEMLFNSLTKLWNFLKTSGLMILEFGAANLRLTLESVSPKVAFNFSLLPTQGWFKD